MKLYSFDKNSLKTLIKDNSKRLQKKIVLKFYKFNSSVLWSINNNCDVVNTNDQ